MNPQTKFASAWLFSFCLLAACSSSTDKDPQDVDALAGDTVLSGDIGNDQAPEPDSTHDGLPGDLAVDTLQPDLETDLGTPDLAQDTAQPPRLGPYDCLVSPDCHRIMIAAHRGDHKNYPENSLAAVRGGAALGADYVELDARITSDGVAVIMHDGTVDSTTDGTGDVSSFTLEAFRQLTLKKSDPANPETLHPITLAEALSLAKELGVMVYLDQKTSQWEVVAQVIRDGGFEHTALVRDDSPIILAMLPTCSDLLMMPAVDSIEALNTLVATFPNVPIVEFAKAEPSKEFCDAAHALGIKVQQDVMATGDTFATLGKTTGWLTFLEAGVNLWQSDLPYILIPAMEEYNETGTFPESVVFQ